MEKINQFLLNAFNPYLAFVVCSPLENIEDRLIWKLTNNGKFSAASTYESICSKKWCQKDKIWEVVWNWKGPERIRVFLWLVIHQVLLTNSQRTMRRMTLDENCEGMLQGSRNMVQVNARREVLLFHKGGLGNLVDR